MGGHFAALLSCHQHTWLCALKGWWEFMGSPPLDQSSCCERFSLFTLMVHRNSPHASSKQPHIFLKFAPFFSRLVSYGEGEARKCPINHLSVLTQLKGRKCRERSLTFSTLHITRAIRTLRRAAALTAILILRGHWSYFQGLDPRGQAHLGCRLPSLPALFKSNLSRTCLEKLVQGVCNLDSTTVKSCSGR